MELSWFRVTLNIICFFFIKSLFGVLQVIIDVALRGGLKKNLHEFPPEIFGDNLFWSISFPLRFLKKLFPIWPLILRLSESQFHRYPGVKSSVFAPKIPNIN
jgi:hypothetical protein